MCSNRIYTLIASISTKPAAPSAAGNFTSSVWALEHDLLDLEFRLKCSAAPLASANRMISGFLIV